MREMRIKNLKAENLVHIVVSIKSDTMLLVSKKLYVGLTKEAKACSMVASETEMNFTTVYGNETLKTVVKFKMFCDQYYRVEEVRVNEKVVYGFSRWNYAGEQIAMDAE